MPRSTTSRTVSITFDQPNSRRVPLLASDEHLAKLAILWAEEDTQKLLELCKIFEISEGPNQWFNLALALAREHYPTPDKRGAKNKWDPTVRALLIAEVKRKLSQPSGNDKSVAWACGRLAMQEPWKALVATKGSGVPSSNPAASLKRAYDTGLKDRRTEMMRRVISSYPPMSDDAWSKLVTDLVKNYWDE